MSSPPTCPNPSELGPRAMIMHTSPSLTGAIACQQEVGSAQSGIADGHCGLAATERCPPLCSKTECQFRARLLMKSFATPLQSPTTTPPMQMACHSPTSMGYRHFSNTSKTGDGEAVGVGTASVGVGIGVGVTVGAGVGVGAGDAHAAHRTATHRKVSLRIPSCLRYPVHVWRMMKHAAPPSAERPAEKRPRRASGAQDPTQDPLAWYAA
ncbi:MAG: hypothetical protein QOJ81_1399 [Chloroflexota bacterium]|nr:hypothetical protein [Chloroflexota bacterium]